MLISAVMLQPVGFLTGKMKFMWINRPASKISAAILFVFTADGD